MHNRHKNGKIDKTEVQPEQQNSIKNNQKIPLFIYPPLPKWEIRLCWLITILTVIYAWFCVYKASSKWQFKIGKSQASITNLPFFGQRIKDESNWEWFRWSPFAFRNYLILLIGHSIIFNILPILFNEKLWRLIYLIISMTASAIVFTPRLLIASILQGLFIFSVTLYFRRSFIVWISALPILYVIMNHTDWIYNDVFLVLLFISYTLLSYISFCLEFVKHLEKQKHEENYKKHNQNTQQNKEEQKQHSQKQEENIQQKHQIKQQMHQKLSLKHSFEQLEKMLFYTFYQPYLFSLIVLYPEFEKQYNERMFKQKDWSKIFFKCLRVAFWWLICELCLYFVYFGSISLDPEFMQKLPKNEFVSIGMAIGSFFHLKYVVIFGLPSIFALIDGMQPPEGPICISRVSLYSKIWRGFDRGLYAFFKEYIFIPICFPTFSLPRKLIGLCISFTFVLLWHGFYHHNIVWIGLNIVELSIEFTAKAIYSIPKVQNIRKHLLSDLNFRRLLGWLQIVPFAFGLYSNFYFLGGSAVGWLFVQRIFWEETVSFRWPFILLITCGYFYTQIAMEIERCWPEKRKVCVFQGEKKEMNGYNEKHKNK